MDNRDLGLYFVFFNEIGIIEQLIRALLEAKLPKGFLISHFSVLNHLVRVKDGQTPLVLARAFQVPKTTMTHTLSILQRHALIEMQPNPKDKRSKCVFITAAGRDFREQTIIDIAPDLEAVSEQFPAHKMSKIVPYLADVRQFLDSYRDRN